MACLVSRKLGFEGGFQSAREQLCLKAISKTV